MMDEIYSLLTGALEVFCDLSSSEYENYHIFHDITNKKFKQLKRKYPIEEIAGKGSDFDRSKNIMRWLHENVMHNGNNPDIEIIKMDPLILLNYSFAKGNKKGLVCRHQAVLFTECCLAIGLIARTLHCLPFSPYDFETHVVSMIYLRELKKWVLFDTTNNAYFINAKGIPLSPIEARYYLGKNDINVNDDIQPRNGNKIETKTSEYKKYMAKNLFYIKYWAMNTYGTDLVKNQKTYYLIPRGFDVKNREILYCEYGTKNTPEPFSSGWEKELIKAKRRIINIVSEKQFLQI